MKQKLSILFILGGLIFSTIGLQSCGDKKKDKYEVQINAVNHGANFDLQALGGLIEQSDSGEQLEALINEPGGINNLDLNSDGQVDYIKVTEYGDGTSRGFSLTVDLGPGDTQEIATVEITKDNSGQSDLHISGSSDVYTSGNNHYYSRVSTGDMLLMAYLFSPRWSPYYSPYSYGTYPPAYRSYSTVSSTTYTTQTKTTRSKSSVKQSSTAYKSKINSPNKGKTSKAVRSPVTQAKNSQKSFEKRDPNKKLKGGGFGEKKATTSNKSSTGSNSFRSGASKSGALKKTSPTKAKPKTRSTPKKKSSSSKRRGRRG